MQNWDLSLSEDDKNIKTKFLYKFSPAGFNSEVMIS
jgi:hypothetical protein